MHSFCPQQQPEPPRGRMVASRLDALAGDAVWSFLTSLPLYSTDAAASRVLLPADSAWWESLDAAPADAQPPSAAQAVELRFMLSSAYDAEVGAFTY